MIGSWPSRLGRPHIVERVNRGGPDYWQEDAHGVPAAFGSRPVQPPVVHPAPPHVQAAQYVPAGQQYPVPPGHAAPPPPRRRPGAGSFSVVLLLAVGLIVAGLQTLPVLGETLASTPSPSASGTSASRASARPASPTPTVGTPSASPTPRPSSSGRPDALRNSPLYALSVSGSCPAIESARTRKQYTDQVDGLLTCLAGIFRPRVEQAGGTFRAVRHTFFGKRADSPCGASSAYAFYCEANRTIYFSNQVYANRSYARLLVSEVVIHEYLHHVQAMMNMFDAAAELSEPRAVTTRRIELQVFCWTYYVFANVESFELTAADLRVFKRIWGSTQDPKGHGSVKAQQYWGPRGFDATTLGACNTWTASRDRVR